MSEFIPTPSQYAAITASGRSILVSAGAGSGKTKVLTERLLYGIANGADIDEYLVITFTKAAAAELKGRISEELAKRIALDPTNKRLKRQSALCRKAQISTIDSFCTALLRENCHLLKLSPEFNVIEEDRAAPMRQRILERVLDEAYENPDPDFLLLVNTVGRGRDDSRLAALTLELHRKMQSHARPALWAEETLRYLSLDCDDVSLSPYGMEVIASLRSSADYHARLLDSLCFKAADCPAIYKAYGSALSEAADSFRSFSLALEKGWDTARALLPIAFPRFGTLRNSPDENLSGHIKTMWASCKAAAKGYASAMASPSEKLLSELRETAPAMHALFELTMAFDRAYANEKRRRSELDFADIEHLAVELLTNPDGSKTDTVLEYGRRFREIMVDEYQDVNNVQETIFNALSRDGNNLFTVGDVKQSIYRFRLADPKIFTEKYTSYSDYGSASEGEPVRIMLRENFRSRCEILNAANRVFSCCMSERLGDIEYDEDARLFYGAKSYNDSVPVPEMTLYALEPDSEDEDTPDKVEAEAAAVAAKIKKLVDSKLPVTDGNTVRPVRYGDIAILMRSANSVGHIYRRELLKVGVPVIGGSTGGFFSSVEISTLLSLLGIIDNPRQDIPLIATLRSPVFGFNADELSVIRSYDTDSDFYTALTKAAEENEKCADFLKLLDELRQEATVSNISSLLWKIYGMTDIMPICTALGDGEERRRNLLLMPEYAKRFEVGTYHGLRRFIRWLLKLRDRGDEPGKGDVGNAVTIMTVHKSKGLEFPVVFLCDTARRFNRSDSRSPVLIHPQLGLAPRYTDTERKLEYPTLAFTAVKMRLENEMLSEEMRLLYVALTRAKEYLYISAAMKEPEKKLSKMSNLASFPTDSELLRSATCLADWLIYACMSDCGGNLSFSVERPYQASGSKAESTVTTYEPDPELAEKIRRRMAFVYPHADATVLPGKITATEFKDEPDTEAASLVPQRHSSFVIPDILRGDAPLSPTERGTATHQVLQYMSLKMGSSIKDIESEIARLASGGFISPKQADAVDRFAIRRFFKSDVGKRLLSADKFHREFRFSLLCPADELIGGAPNEKLLLQGEIDCCIEENGELTIIDYKTDHVYGEAIAERAKSYYGQLRAYAYAAERIFGKKVRECIIYFVNSGTAISADCLLK